MHPSPSLRSTFAALFLSLAPFATAADTIVVDDDGGPGVDFTNLPPAIAAADPGDLIVVRAGSYTWITLDKGLRILAEPGVTLPLVEIRLVPADQLVHVSGLYADWYYLVRDCAGPVLLEHLTSGSQKIDFLDVEDCADVRVRHATFRNQNGTGIDVKSSFIEVVDVVTEGGDNLGGGEGGDGGRGMNLFLDSTAVVARTTCEGGHGGNHSTGEAGNGGYGLAASNSWLVLTGNPFAQLPWPHGDYWVRGGNAGDSLDHGQGFGGHGLYVSNSFARVSGVTFQGGDPGGQPILFGGHTLEQPAVPDPDLELVEPLSLPSFGGALAGTGTGTLATLRIHGPVGGNARLAIGVRPIVEPHPTIRVPRLVEVQQYLLAGEIANGGTVDYPFKLPAGAARGDLIIAQADIVPPGGGTTLRTHSIHFMVR